MNKKLGQTGLNRADLTNDMYVSDLVAVAKTLGVRYIVRPAVLNINSESSSETSINPAAFIPIFGMFSNPTKTTNKKSATVTIKVDIISVTADDIVGTGIAAAEVGFKTPGIPRNNRIDQNEFTGILDSASFPGVSCNRALVDNECAAVGKSSAC